MKNIILLFVIVGTFFTTSAQMDSLWERASAHGNIPTWFTTAGHTERGFTHGVVGGNPRLYVVSRNAGTFVKIVDPVNGADLGDLITAGISGGTYSLNDIGATIDGNLFATNLAIGAATANFKIYRWTSESDSPKVVLDSPVSGDTKRLGDRITVLGSVSDNSATIWAADPTGQRLYIFKTTDFGTSFVLSDSVKFPTATLGSAPACYPIPQDTIFICNSNGKLLTAWSYSGVYMGEIPGGVLASGSNSCFFVDVNGNPLIVSFQYGAGNENARVIDVGGEMPFHARTYTLTQSLGTNANANGVGDIDFVKMPDGSLIVFVLSTNNGIGAYKISFPMIVNGRFQEGYTTVANKLNQNLGFGPNINIKRLNYKIVNNNLYIGITSRLDRSNNNGILLFLGLSNLNGTGAAQNTSLGGVTGGGHAFGDASNPNFKNDFETHFAFAINPGGNDSVVYVDAVKYSNGNKVGQYIGLTYNYGHTSSGPSVDGIFTANSVKFGFDSAYGHNRGFELCIPFGELGNPTVLHNLVLFGVVASSTAYFSDVTVPGNVGGGNPGFNANFATLPGGPYGSLPTPLPVELNSFTASAFANSVTLNWNTASELNNSGFEVQQSYNGSDFAAIGFVSGHGNSSELHKYTFAISDLSEGKYSFRLKQIDYDAAFTLSNSVEVDINSLPTEFAITQNYPNPFNPVTNIKFSVKQNGLTTLKIFNAIGEEVASLYNALAETGKIYEINFDGTALNSGIYFYRLQQGSNVVTKKMVLLK